MVLAPVRRGHGDSEGPYVMDQLRRGQDNHASASLAVRLMEGEHLDDQLAGQAYLKRLPYVDSTSVCTCWLTGSACSRCS